MNLHELFDKCLNKNLIDLTISGRKDKSQDEVSKVKIRPVIIKNNLLFQISEYKGTKVYHDNYSEADVRNYIEKMMTDNFKQAQFKMTDADAQVLSGKNSNMTIKYKKSCEVRCQKELSHNRNKKYILEEGKKVDFLVDLGVMTKEGKIVNQRYDKYRQINRFLEFIEDILPELDSTRRKKLLGKYVKQRNEIPYHYRNWLARRIVDFITFGVNANTKVVGAEKIKHIKSGAIITSNHFNPVDTTIIRYGIKKARRYRMFIVSQDTNFAMKGFLGFLMRYADEIPVSKDKDYMERHFYRTLNNLLVNKKEYILIYPEQEMWFNYRKPRPPKRGAYFYAAKFNVPIISCFVEMKDMDKDDTEEFKRVKYVLHILDPIYPDPEKNERDNSFDMMKKDYEQKKAAYEQIYKRPLDYAFSDSDIAGWKGTTE